MRFHFKRSSLSKSIQFCVFCSALLCVCDCLRVCVCVYCKYAYLELIQLRNQRMKKIDKVKNWECIVSLFVCVHVCQFQCKVTSYLSQLPMNTRSHCLFKNFRLPRKISLNIHCSIILWLHFISSHCYLLFACMYAVALLFRSSLFCFFFLS